jgi:hypothetical protein
MKVKYVELHTPLFLGNKNFGLKITATTGLELTYDRAEKELCVKWGGQTAYLPSTSVSSYQPGEAVVAPKTVQVASGKAVKAQASLPPGMREE